MGVVIRMIELEVMRYRGYLVEETLKEIYVVALKKLHGDG